MCKGPPCGEAEYKHDICPAVLYGSANYNVGENLGKNFIRVSNST